jgi:error-prone DNA polymerase
VYASCWLKHRHPMEFLAAMINAQPLGFYSPSQLVQDAKRHGVQVLPPDAMFSDWDCKLEETAAGLAVRLGLRLVRGLQKASAEAISKARGEGPFESAEDLSLRAGLNHQQMTALAAGDALMSLSGHRRQQAWDAAALRAAPPLLEGAPINEEYLELPEAPEGEAVVKDYESLGLTLRRHPLALLRPQLQERQLMSAAELEAAQDRRQVRACGIVTTRQQPETAKGTIFISLEDETGEVQVIVHKAIWERQRQEALSSRLLAVKGTWQLVDGVRNLIAGHLEDLTPLLGGLRTKRREFR